MYLEIISPEATLFAGEVDSVIVPGSAGSFQMLNNHAPIVSTLKEGIVKISGKIDLDDSVKDKFLAPQPFKSWSLDASDDWQSPIDRPSITEEGDVRYMISWNETKYQADNTKGWEPTKTCLLYTSPSPTDS